MEINKIVARYKGGIIKKGTTSDFFPNKNLFHIKLLNGEIMDINVEELKSIYFVKDFEGDKDRNDMYNDVVPGGGRKIRVEFSDGETLIGYSQGYSPNRQGFFVVPADTNSNNERIFVVSSATKSVTFISS
jgi:hypothetical protein